jgi:hypothetical protein
VWERILEIDEIEVRIARPRRVGHINILCVNNSSYTRIWTENFVALQMNFA